MMWWNDCLLKLREEIPNLQFNMWIAPLRAELKDDLVTIYAHNKYVFDNVSNDFFEKIKEVVSAVLNRQDLRIELKQVVEKNVPHILKSSSNTEKDNFKSYLNKNFVFDKYVTGKSNELAKAAAIQVAQNPGESYNPLFIYGGVGLGKTHLMQAIGNEILRNKPETRVLYTHSEKFVNDMVQALQKNNIDEFKSFYRSINVLLIDDIQFFAGKDRSQEEFFHTFNSLIDHQKQIVITCDKYPKEIEGLEDRLKSRFGWGLTVAIDPPELETRVAILLNKASQFKVNLPSDVAFFIAKYIKANVRELEGALKRVIASSKFLGTEISLSLAKESLKDLLTVQARMVTIDNIQKTVAHYYKIKLVDLLGKSRQRDVTRPRQMAILLAKELTDKSLPEIGRAFGNRDHTTIMHACHKMKELLEANVDLQEDYQNLTRLLSI